MRVLSLGAGVQSSTLYLMACEGELQIDGAIFADTGWEPSAVYDWLAVLKAEGERAGIPLHTVQAGNLRDDELRRPYTLMPLRVLNNGKSGMMRRQCTERYKIRPINRKLREWGATKASPCELLIGISLDEYHRMKPSQNPIATHAWPLIERRMTRDDCVRWLSERGYAEPMKSSCVGCPYHDNAHWRAMKSERPAEWNDAVEFDASIRRGFATKVTGEAFLHRSLVPLAEADLRSEQDRGQMDMFDGCGVLCASEGVA